MADPRRTSTRRAVLSYDRLKALYKESKPPIVLPDLLIKDYQGIIQDFAFTADEIDSIDSDVAANTDAIDLLDIRVTANELAIASIPEWRTVIAITPYDAVAFDDIEARTTRINLPESPSENDEVIVSSDFSGNVLISGNGNQIKFKALEVSVTISQKGTSLHFKYFIAGGYWRII